MPFMSVIIRMKHMQLEPELLTETIIGRPAQ